jgi:hypothetical protein
VQLKTIGLIGLYAFIRGTVYEETGKSSLLGSFSPYTEGLVFAKRMEAILKHLCIYGFMALYKCYYYLQISSVSVAT